MKPADENLNNDHSLESLIPFGKYDGINTVNSAREYLETCIADPHLLPTIEGLALKLNVSCDAIEKWSKKFLVIRQIRDRIILMQKDRLMNNVVFGGKFSNAGGGIFLLKANHGMVETSRNLVGNADGSNLEALKIYKPEKNKE